MTNKVITIFEDNKAIKMERYENDVMVGSRKMLPAEYFTSMASNLTPGALMSILVHDNDFSRSLSNLQSEEYFEEFITAILKNVPSYFLSEGHNKLNPLLVSMVKAVIENTSSFKDVDSHTLRTFVKALSSDSKFEFDDVLLDLTKHLLNQLLKKQPDTPEGRIARMSIFKMMYKSLTNEQQKVEKELLYSILSGFSTSDYKEFVDTSRQFLSDREVCEFEGVIPQGCSYMFKTNKRTYYGYELKKSRYRIKFHNEFIGEIGHPRLAVFYTVKSDGLVNSMRIFAMKDDGKRLNGDSELFQYPYSNVYENGEVCWGEKQTFSIEDMSFAASGFLMANNTGHLTNRAVEFLNSFKDADFDDDILNFKGKVKDTL